MAAPQIVTSPTSIEGGWRVRTTAMFHVDILRMGYGNLRIVLTPVDTPGFYGRAWCYQEPLVAVVLRAHAFDPDTGTEPEGWVKEAGTERRACAHIFGVFGPHQGYVADCPDCGVEKYPR